MVDRLAAELMDAANAPRRGVQEARGHAAHGRGQPRSPIIAGERRRWPEPLPSSATATSASWPTSMPARPRPRSASCSTPEIVQDRRGARGHRRDGLDGAGAGARHHHHLGRDHRVLEGSSINIIDTPATSTSRSRSSARCAGRRDRGVRFGRRGRAAVGDGVAPGGQVPRAADLLRQQDGPDRRRLFPLHSDDQDRLGATPCRLTCRWRRGRLRRQRRPDREPRGHLEGRHARRRVRVSRDPARAGRQAARIGPP